MLTRTLLILLLLSQTVLACPDFRTSRHKGCTGAGCYHCKRGVPAPVKFVPTASVNGKPIKLAPARVTDKRVKPAVKPGR